MFPPKLKPGDGIRVIAPSCSMSSIRWLNDEYMARVEKRFTDMGLRVTYGKHVREIDDFDSSSIESRIKDLHDAFADPTVQAVHAIRGGFAGNQLLDHLPYDLLKKNPKILCGFSDITVFQNAIYAKTGLVSYSGPNYYSFGYGKEFEYTLDYWKKCLMHDAPFRVEPSHGWTDERWSSDQQELKLKQNEGWWILETGEAEGTLLGGNLCTLNLLQGTEYMPDLSNSILFLEDDYESRPHTFDRDLQSLLHLPSARTIRALVIGRFQPASKMTESLLRQIIKSKRELRDIPVVANVDFGHTQPMITFPVGGTVKIEAKSGQAMIEIVKH